MLLSEQKTILCSILLSNQNQSISVGLACGSAMCGLKEGGREGARCGLRERSQKHLDALGLWF